MKGNDKIIYDTLELNLKSTRKDYRLSRGELNTWTGWADRTLRANIARARRLGLRIISDNDNAGYYLGTADEWNAFCDRERKRAMANLYPKTHEMNGQLEIVFVDSSAGFDLQDAYFKALSRQLKEKGDLTR